MPPVSDPWYGFLLLGLAIGVISGMLGIGGGVLVIPALVFLFAFPHRLAVGTSLAMLLPPIGLFALLHYWPDNIHVKGAAFLALGFAIGGYFGGMLAHAAWMSERFLRVMFAFFMLYVAGNMLFRSDPRIRAAMKTGLIMAGFAGAYLFAWLLGRKWEKRGSAALIYHNQAQKPLSPDYEI